MLYRELFDEIPDIDMINLLWIDYRENKVFAFSPLQLTTFSPKEFLRGEDQDNWRNYSSAIKIILLSKFY
jgi:hypothetical protein